jgi:hypothetical protein
LGQSAGTEKFSASHRYHIVQKVFPPPRSLAEAPIAGKEKVAVAGTAGSSMTLVLNSLLYVNLVFKVSKNEATSA